MLHPAVGRTLGEPVGELSGKARNERGVEFGSCGQRRSDFALRATQIPDREQSCSVL